MDGAFHWDGLMKCDSGNVRMDDKRRKYEQRNMDGAEEGECTSRTKYEHCGFGGWRVNLLNSG
jgi:hypothetical protein